MARVDIHHHVPHIRQQDQNYCWACAFAMLLGRGSWQAALDLADRVPGDFRNPATGALRNPVRAARALHLHPEPAGILTPEELAPRLARGPIAIFGTYVMAGSSFDHVMVLSMMRGDTRNPQSVVVGVDDPYANGTRWSGSWNAFYGPTLMFAHTLVMR